MEFAEIAALSSAINCGSASSVCPLYRTRCTRGWRRAGRSLGSKPWRTAAWSRGRRAGQVEDCLLCGACAANCPSFVPRRPVPGGAGRLAKELGLRCRSDVLKRSPIPGALAVGTPGLHLAHDWVATVRQRALARSSATIRAALRAMPRPRFGPPRTGPGNWQTNGDGRRERSGTSPAAL